MIIEHENIINDVNELMGGILQPYTIDVDFTVKYLNDCHLDILEVFVRNGRLQQIDNKKFLKEMKKSDIVKEIYTIDDGKHYSIYLRSLKEIRNNKINKLQKRIYNEAYN